MGTRVCFSFRINRIQILDAMKSKSKQTVFVFCFLFFLEAFSVNEGELTIAVGRSLSCVKYMCVLRIYIYNLYFMWLTVTSLDAGRVVSRLCPGSWYRDSG